MSILPLKSPGECRWDVTSLGEILLRFDPENERIHNARSFRVWDGGAEYNAAKNLAKVFRQRTTIVTALADNALGRLAEDLAKQGGVDASNITWRDADSNQTRNGIYFIERGFGLRSPTSCFDRSNTAVSQLQTGEIDWKKIFGAENGSRWFHTGGVFSGLSDNAPSVAAEAMKFAQESGAIVSYDLNYRDSLWKMRGGRAEANRINKTLLPFADVVFGVLDYEAKFSEFNIKKFQRAAEKMQTKFPNLKIIATTLREIKSASLHNLSAACFAGGEVFKARDNENVEVLDRVGSGDAFAAGFIFGLLMDKGANYALECGAAHACLAMTTPGDNSMAQLAEIEKLMQGEGANVIR
jgi:2-dehydro-3-deoxygluconokinase